MIPVLPGLPPRRLVLAGVCGLALSSAMSASAIALPTTALSPAALSPAAPLSTARGLLWAKACATRPDGTNVCYVEQFAIDQARNQVVLHVQLGYLGPDGQPRLVVTAPLGVSLAGGVNLALDADKPIGVPFQTCASDGCMMIAVLQPDVLTRLLKAKSMTVTFLDAANAPIAVPVRLEGLADAFTAAQKKP
ncbi:MAG TPA: invasion associated locus B family protein [Caulobacteraceae bacterium]|nr:invasion associated locus B family protein [Caulobacteraceae bacterium]